MATDRESSTNLFDGRDVLGVVNDYFGDETSEYASSSDYEGDVNEFEQAEGLIIDKSKPN